MTPYLLVDNARVPAEAVERPVFRFRLHLPAREIRLISGSASPAEMKRSSDTRRLGVLVHAMRWVRDDTTIDVPLDSPAFLDGFHNKEVHAPGSAAVRWTTGNAGLPSALFPPWHGSAVLELTLGEWPGSSHEAGASREAELLSAFESLGEDCEFGLAQRYCLVEPPLTLFRWAGAPIATLIDGLETGFRGLGDPDSTSAIWDGKEYFLQTPLMAMHTNCTVEQDATGLADLVRSGCATLRLLRRKLLKDIADAKRIFVFKSLASTLDENDVHRLHSALQRIGPATLLCAVLARPGQPGGQARRLGERLYAGYLTRFVIPEGPFDEWVSVCAATMALLVRDSREAGV